MKCKNGFVKDGGGEEVGCGLNGQFEWTFGKISCRPATQTGRHSLTDGVTIQNSGPLALGRKMKVVTQFLRSIHF